MPFAGYKDFAACVAANRDKENPEAYCAKIMHEAEGKKKSALQKAAGSGLMVAFLLPEEAAKALAVPGGEPPEDLHLTLAYMGPIEELPAGTIERALAAVQGFAARQPPLSGKANGVGRFNASSTSDGEDVIYASFDAPDLSRLREDLVMSLAMEDVYCRRDHGFTPHITLAYIPKGATAQVENIEPLPIRFDRILVAAGDLREEFRLRGRPPMIQTNKARTVKKALSARERLEKQAIDEWAERWHQVLPRGGRALPFWVHVKQVRKGKTWTDVSLQFRFQYDREHAWGFSLAGAEPVAKGSALPARPKSLGPWTDAAFSTRGAKLVVKDRGTYRLAFACDNAVEVILDSKDHSGRWVFQKGADGWSACRSGGAPFCAGVDLATTLEALHRQGVKHALLPRDPVNLSHGHRLVDLAKATGRLARYALIKRADENRYTLGVAYPAREVDAHGDFAKAEEIERAAWRFMQAPKVGLMHKFGTEGRGRVVESYIYRFEKTKFGGQDIRPGDWLLGVVWDEPSWELIKSGALSGFSIQGWARKA